MSGLDDAAKLPQDHRSSAKAALKRGDYAYASHALKVIAVIVGALYLIAPEQGHWSGPAALLVVLAVLDGLVYGWIAWVRPRLVASPSPDA